MNIPQSERLIRLNATARKQIELLQNNKNIKVLDKLKVIE